MVIVLPSALFCRDYSAYFGPSLKVVVGDSSEGVGAFIHSNLPSLEYSFSDPQIENVRRKFSLQGKLTYYNLFHCNTWVSPFY